ncbi:hypothetical protein C0J52_13598 [Blattella germanica]|nr:hypothetical protein C0J52_13598 [Blattella germanica]
MIYKNPVLQYKQEGNAAMLIRRQRIIGAVQLITPDMLVNTWQEIEYRFGLCRDINGAYVEVH